MTEEQIIDAISLARMQNNKNWMAILALAFRVAPSEARLILKRINRQDQKISEMLNELASLGPPDEDQSSQS